MQQQVTTTIALILALAAAPALAAPKLERQMTVEKDIVVVEKGKQVTKRVEAKQQAPGEVTINTYKYRNTGDEAATGVRIDIKVPTGTTYVDKSAKGPADAVFSIDQGKTFAAPAQLTYEVVNAQGVKETVVAPAEKYTDIRWVIPQIAAGASGQVSYSLRIK